MVLGDGWQVGCALPLPILVSVHPDLSGILYDCQRNIIQVFDP